MAAHRTRTERDAAIVADLIAGRSLNEIAADHHVAKKTILALKRVPTERVMAEVRAARPAVSPSVSTVSDVETDLETTSKPPPPAVGPADATNLARILVEHLNENFRTQAAILRLAQDEEWLAKFGPLELAQLFAAIADRAAHFLDLLAPAD